jgi:hypothetical protein
MRRHAHLSDLAVMVGGGLVVIACAAGIAAVMARLIGGTS